MSGGCRVTLVEDGIFWWLEWIPKNYSNIFCCRTLVVFVTKLC